MSPVVLGAIGMALVLVFMFLGIPMAVAGLTVGIVGLILLRSWSAAFVAMEIYSFDRVSSWGLSVIPMFVFMGIILFEAGIADTVFDALRAWLQHIPGGLFMSVAIACAALGTCTGSSFATSTVMAKMAYPQMRKLHYDRALSFGVIAASGPIAAVMPPSVICVTYAILAQVSIGKCLMAGVFPALLTAFCFCAMLYIKCKINPALGPVAPAATWKERWSSLRYLGPVIVMFLIVSVGMIVGIFTATEAGGIGAFAACIIALMMRKLTWRVIRTSILETLGITTMVLITIGGITVFTDFLVHSKFSPALATACLKIPAVGPIEAKWMVIIAILVLYFVLGMVVGGPLVYVTVPVLAPALELMGFDLIWFGMLTLKMTEIGWLSPPVAMNVFVTQAVLPEVPLDVGFAGAWWFIYADLVAMVFLVLFPQISLFIPYTIMAAK